ncbi:cAMP-specific 3',5'-cyclic phosphodiesterase 4B [Varanus komodoensis]|nr:cAMP-specific 3',5'-cyclic phosphodiesterase 4B [Varanus komodoensis]
MLMGNFKAFGYPFLWCFTYEFDFDSSSSKGEHIEEFPRATVHHYHEEKQECDDGHHRGGLQLPKFLAENAKDYLECSLSKSYSASTNTLGIDLWRGRRGCSGNLQLPPLFQRQGEKGRTPDRETICRPTTLPLLTLPSIAITTYQDRIVLEIVLRVAAEKKEQTLSPSTSCKPNHLQQKFAWGMILLVEENSECNP